MKTLSNTPALMTVIINIQMMSEKINPYYNKYKDFKRLEKLSEDELYDIQDTLIPLYNKSIKMSIEQ